MKQIACLKKRREFIAVSQSGIKYITPGFVLQVRAWDKTENYGNLSLRFGLTASKKTGNAVRRNRIRRRLRALAKELLPHLSISEYDFIFIARYRAWDRKYTDLKSDFHKALSSLNKNGDINLLGKES